MKVVRFGLIGVALTMLGACASDPSTQSSSRPTQDDPSKGIICTKEVPTGSALPVRKCTTPEERDAQRRDAEHRIQYGTAP